MTPWINFFTLTGEAAATLVGLMFIAVTFGQKLVTQETVQMAKDILTPIFFHFGHAFMISCVALIPAESLKPLAAATIALSLVRIANSPRVIRQLKQAASTGGHIEKSDWWFSVAIPLAIYVALFASSTGILCNAIWGIYGVALSMIALLLLGILAAWDMLIWMASQVE